MIDIKLASALVAAFISTTSLASAGENLVSASSEVHYNNGKMDGLESVSIDNIELDHDKLTVIVEGAVFSSISRRKASCHYVLREGGELLHSKAYVISEGFLFDEKEPAHPDEADFICREYQKAAFPRGLDSAFLTSAQVAEQIDAAQDDELSAIIGSVYPAENMYAAHPVTLHLPQAQVSIHIRCLTSSKRIAVSDGERVFGGKLPLRATEKICNYLYKTDERKGA